MQNDETNSIETHIWLFRDEPLEAERLERLNFHLQTGDYFPMLATVLGFAQEAVQQCNCVDTEKLLPMEASVLKGIRNDLLYLHKNYRIVPITDAN